MFVNKVTGFHRLQNVINYNSTRYLRGGVTIPLKLIKSNNQQKKIPKYTNDQLNKLRKFNEGVGHSLGTYVEHYGPEIERFVDEDLLEDPDMAMEDIKPHTKELESKFWKYDRKKTLYNIKRKYFPTEKLPNMLTYIEKEQIKRLHKNDPDEWCVEKLAESFPATPEIIKKVLKSRFTAYTVEIVKKHDHRVKSNWELFKKGKLQVDDDLRKIYSSFVDRLQLDTNEEEIKKFIPSPPDFASQISRKEFSTIVTSSKKYQLEKQNRKKEIEYDGQGRVICSAPSETITVIDEDANSDPLNTHYTLDEFRKTISDGKSGKKHKGLDHIILGEKPHEQYLPLSKDLSAFQSKTYDYLRDTGIVNKDYDPLMLDKKVSGYKLRINIPVKIRQKNKLYKVSDCFYDENGYFLYRVPGFVN